VTATGSVAYGLFTDARRQHQAGRLVDAERLYRQVLQREPRHPDALHLLGVLAHQVGHNQAAVDLIAQAIRVNPTVAAYHYSRGVALTDLGRLDEAVAAYRAALGLNPQDADAAANLGLALKDLGRFTDAVRAYRAALCITPDDADAHAKLATALKNLGRFEAAVLAYGVALRIAPDNADSRCNLGTALSDLGRFDDAVASFTAALGIKPDLAEAHANRGVALNRLERGDAAAAAFTAALCLKPDHPQALSNLGALQKARGRPDAAIAGFEAALRVRPDYAQAHCNRGGALSDLGRYEAAIAAFRTSLVCAPGVAEAWANAGNALRDAGRLDAAATALTVALRITPDLTEAHSFLGNVLADLGRFDDAVAAYGAALGLSPDYAPAHSNRLMCLHYHPVTGDQAIFTLALQFADQVEAAPPVTLVPTSAEPDRRLRIGYVSGDFRRHPVGYFLDRVLAGHDRRAVEVFCYSTGLRRDDLTTRLQGSADGWRSLVGLSDQAAAVLIAADAIDILVDLAGHTGDNRLPVFARKPAPIQVSWLGFWGTTGLSRMDYILSDAVMIGPGEEGLYREQVVRLAGTRLCYAPPDYAPPPPPPPALRQRTITFGSFNNLAKVGPDVVRHWSDILQAVPGSRLLLKWKSLADAGMRRRLTEAFAAAGVDADRLELRGASAHPVMLAEYGDVDIALDPFPFSGGLTSCEALWMGVPVVTVPGAAAASRQTAGILKALGLTSWVAASPAAAIAIISSLAADLPQLTRWRQDLRRRMAGSSLCDGAGFAAGLERAYREMWRRRCAGRPAHSFDLD
jgi:predicted O-linked N-acetylglucosamine transferase (SPINDLY family)